MCEFNFKHYLNAVQLDMKIEKKGGGGKFYVALVIVSVHSSKSSLAVSGVCALSSLCAMVMPSATAFDPRSAVGKSGLWQCRD